MPVVAEFAVLGQSEKHLRSSGLDWTIVRYIYLLLFYCMRPVTSYISGDTQAA